MSVTPVAPRVFLMLDSLVPGGAERSTVAMLPSVAERGFALEVVTLHDRPGLQPELEARGVPLHCLAGPGGRRGRLLRARRLLAEHRPDLVHTSLFDSDVIGRLAARSRGIPVVSTLTTARYGSAHLDAPHLRASKIRQAQLVDAVTARLAVRMHAVSSYVADAMAGRLRYPRARIDVIYRGREPRPMSSPDRRNECRTQLRDELGLEPDQAVVLMTARHEYAKGIDRMVEAMPTLIAARPRAVLVVAGREGAQSPALSALVERLDLHRRVRFLGHRNDVGALLEAADVFVLPSRREGLPGSLLEAMATGLPTVVNDMPEVAEVVDSRHSMIVDASRPQSLGQGVANVLGDRATASRRAAVALSRFEGRFSLSGSADGMAAFYRSALGIGEAAGSAGIGVDGAAAP